METKAVVFQALWVFIYRVPLRFPNCPMMSLLPARHMTLGPQTPGPLVEAWIIEQMFAKWLLWAIACARYISLNTHKCVDLKFLFTKKVTQWWVNCFQIGEDCCLSCSSIPLMNGQVDREDSKDGKQSQSHKCPGMWGGFHRYTEEEAEAQDQCLGWRASPV